MHLQRMDYLFFIELQNISSQFALLLDRLTKQGI